MKPKKCALPRSLIAFQLIMLVIVPTMAQHDNPEVHPNGTVTFRLSAKVAKHVTVSGSWSEHATPMKQSDQGVWSLTIGPLTPEIYRYRFSVDGFLALDPANPSGIVEIPGDSPLLHEFQRVPHGNVNIVNYNSRALGKRRSMYVYTPPGYEAESTTKYPVLYLLHGSGSNETTWFVEGRAQWILDNLISQGKAKPMVVVTPYCHASFARPQVDGEDGSAPFDADLFQEIIPYLERHYRVKPDRMGRAIAGSSMGGGMSLILGLREWDKFAWIGCFSSGVGSPERVFTKFFQDPEATNANLGLLWFACGRNDKELTPKLNHDFARVLKEAGIRHEYRETDGGHEISVWRKYFAEFAQKLF